MHGTLESRTKRILVTGAGGAASIGFIRSIRLAPEKFYIVGTDGKYFVYRSEADINYIGPFAEEGDYIQRLNGIIEKEHIEFVHAQPDREVYQISKHREKLGAITFLPKYETVEICTNKFTSYLKWKKAGISVPKTTLIRNAEDLRWAFEDFGPNLWLRQIFGAAGKGSIRTDKLEIAKAWIDFKNGWNIFQASEYLSPDSITWQSIWKEGELIVAQTRKRILWEFSDRSPSGVTGITGVSVTASHTNVDRIAQESILAVDKDPNGIFCVDMTYDNSGIPNPTEINIGRFFTTTFFFTRAGLNMPYIYVKLAYNENIPRLERRINPLPNGLYWIRGMDIEPKLISETEMEDYKKNRV